VNILFIVPYVPDPIRVRPYQFIRGLAKRGHNVTVVTLWTTEWERGSAEKLRGVCASVHDLHLPKIRSFWNCLQALPSGDPLQAAYCWQPKMTQVLRDLLQPSNGGTSYDIIHIEHLRGAEYGLWLKRWLSDEGISIPIVWDSVDSISLLFRLASQKSLSLSRRLVTGFELPRTEKYEGRLAKVFDGVLTTSEADARELRRLSRTGGGGKEIIVVPNGVDLSYFKPKNEYERKKHQIVMTGKMSYHANISMAIHFVEEILPRIQAQQPNVELWIVGKDPSREVQLLAKRPGVIVTGTVADIRPFLWEASVAVAPLTYAVGIQNKVLEAMASRTPVVVSTAAATSLEIADNREARIARSPEHFAGAVNELLDDPAMRERIASAGREYVERNHDWKQIAQRLEAIYDGIITTCHRRTT